MGKVVGMIRFLSVAVGLLGVAACSADFRNHGYVPEQDDLDNIIVGKDTRETVAQIIGAPTASGILDQSGWYYVESRFRRLGFGAPKEIERQVVAITFDARGRLSNIERFGLEDGQVVTLSRRVTQSSTAKISFLRRLLGNVGRFSG